MKSLITSVKPFRFITTIVSECICILLDAKQNPNVEYPDASCSNNTHTVSATRFLTPLLVVQC